jgi:hypothetical protein
MIVAGTRPVRRRVPRVVWICGVLLVSAFVAATVRLFVTPSLRPLPTRADAIIELAGPGDAARDRVALDLAGEGRAPVLAQSTLTGDTSCLPSVARVRIVCFHPNPDTTRGEARFIGAMAAKHHWTSVILVTTPDQAWRARLRVSRCFSGTIYSATARLPWRDWIRQIPYQWTASVKALTVERSC